MQSAWEVWQHEQVFWYYGLMTTHQAKRSSLSPATEGRGLPATYQTRICDYRGMDRGAGEDLLSDYAHLCGRIERKLFADISAGRLAASLKRDYLRRHRIPGRMFNGVRVSLEGKVASVREQQQLRVDHLKRRIVRAESQLAQSGPDVRRDWLHQKKRRLGNLQARVEKLEGDMAAGRVRLCFGSRRLWRKQYSLEANGYASHGQWLEDWQSARRDEFFVLGSRDETAGCQLCVATVADDGSLTLRLRLPDALACKDGKYLVIHGVRFKYGQEQVLAALESNAEYSAFRRQRGDKAARASGLGQAISYRFKKDSRGWRVFVTTRMAVVPVVTDKRRGAVGVDLNADHLAVCETDASGNYTHAFRVPLVTYGKSQHQAQALIGDAVARVVKYAQQVGKPIVMEKLDFRQKKAVLEGESPWYGRMLASFSYGMVKAYFLSRGYRQGVEVHEVNPAFSSVVGRVKFMERYGLSVHQAAALVLARRFLGCSERIPRQRVCPIGNGVHVTFFVPARKRGKHVWTYWGAIWGQLRPVLAAQHRLGRRRRLPNPVRAVGRAEARGVAERGPDRCSRVRVPGGVALHCWGGGAAQTASSGMADEGPVTIINHFYNGMQDASPHCPFDRASPLNVPGRPGEGLVSASWDISDCVRMVVPSHRISEAKRSRKSGGSARRFLLGSELGSSFFQGADYVVVCIRGGNPAPYLQGRPWLPGR